MRARVRRSYTSLLLLLLADAAAMRASVASMPRATVSMLSSEEAEAFDSCDAETTWCTTSSGFRYVDEATGSGDMPVASQSVVKVSYSGSVLSDGRAVEFAGAKSPLVWKLGSGLPVWEEAIEGMRVGGRRRLLVPPSASVTAVGTGLEAATETVRFEFELQGIESGAPAMLAELRARAAGVKLPQGAPRLKWQGWLLLLSLLPYLLPNELRPGPWQGDWGFFTGEWLRGGGGVEDGLF